MSATNRGAVRNEADFYPTPSWCVHRLQERIELPGGNWMEPCAGDGAIIRAVNRDDVKWTAVDIRTECRESLLQLVPEIEVKTGMDFLAGGWTPDRSVIITNPPYALAMEFVQHSLKIAPWVVMLLRLNFLGSAKRSAFFRKEMPDVYVLPNRPSFTGHGTDATEYAWMVWTPERGRRWGRQEVLDETPAHERRAA